MLGRASLGFSLAAADHDDADDADDDDDDDDDDDADDADDAADDADDDMKKEAQNDEKPELS